LQAALGDTAHVIEDGLCGRTTVFDDPHIENRNGKRALPYCLPETPAAAPRAIRVRFPKQWTANCPAVSG